MGRPAAKIRHLDIVEAQKRFERSREGGSPDWRLVALAVGQRPDNPPEWAMRACIELHEKELLAGSREGGELSSHVIGGLLDGIVDFYHRAEIAFETDERRRVWDKSGDGPFYSRPPLDRAIDYVCREAGVLVDAVGGANRDPFRPLRNAWEDEQKQSTLSHDDAILFLEDWSPTHRIARVLGEPWLKANELPLNISQALWFDRRGLKPI